MASLEEVRGLKAQAVRIMNRARAQKRAQLREVRSSRQLRAGNILKHKVSGQYGVVKAQTLGSAKPWPSHSKVVWVLVQNLGKHRHGQWRTRLWDVANVELYQ